MTTPRNAERTGRPPRQLRRVAFPCLVAGCVLHACAADGSRDDARLEDAARAAEDGAQPDGSGALSDAASDADGERPDASAPTAQVRPSAGCRVATPAGTTDTTVTLDHDGLARAFVLHVGATVNAAVPAPLWLDWHGLGSDAEQQRGYSRSADMADERGFVVAYPQAIRRAFNAGPCCGLLTLPPHSADDVGFGRAIVEQLAETLCIDLNRVYSLGMSNGGYMSEYNACQAADLYAAVAPVSGMNISYSACKPARPIPIIAFNGTEDKNVSYADSRESVAAWVARNGCSAPPKRVEHGGSYCETWACAEGTELTSCTLTGMNHCWPGNPLVIPSYCASGGLADLDATAMIADFFARFHLTD